MAKETPTKQILENLQKRIKRLEAAMAAFRAEETDAGQDRRVRRGNRKAEVVSPNAFARPGVYPPTTQDEPEAIVGGRPTTDFPDCCAVGDGSAFYCTGTLIAPNLV